MASKSRTATRRREAPEVEAILAKLDSALIAVAPISHMFPPEPAKPFSHDPSALPVGAKLSASSVLRPRARETVAEVVAKLDGTESAEVLANKLRFAVPNTDIGPAAASIVGGGAGEAAADGSGRLGRTAGGGTSARVGVTFGVSTLTRDDVAALSASGGRGSLPPDAEVRKLTSKYTSPSARAAGVPEDTSRLFAKFANTSTVGQTKAPLRDTVEIVIKASGAEPKMASAYAVGHAYTDEVSYNGGAELTARLPGLHAAARNASRFVLLRSNISTLPFPVAAACPSFILHASSFMRPCPADARRRQHARLYPRPQGRRDVALRGGADPHGRQGARRRARGRRRRRQGRRCIRCWCSQKEVEPASSIF